MKRRKKSRMKKFTTLNVRIKSIILSIIMSIVIVACTLTMITYYPFDLPQSAKVVHILLMFYIGCILLITNIGIIIWSATTLVIGKIQNMREEKVQVSKPDRKWNHWNIEWIIVNCNTNRKGNRYLFRWLSVYQVVSFYDCVNYHGIYRMASWMVLGCILKLLFETQYLYHSLESWLHKASKYKGAFFTALLLYFTFPLLIQFQLRIAIRDINFILFHHLIIFSWQL